MDQQPISLSQQTVQEQVQLFDRDLHLYSAHLKIELENDQPVGIERHLNTMLEVEH